MTGLTARQADLLRFIERYTADHGLCPTFDEMRIAMGLQSKGRVHRLVTDLVERGAIRRLPNRARAIEVVRSAGGQRVAFRVDGVAFGAVVGSEKITPAWVRQHGAEIRLAVDVWVESALTPARSAAE